MSGIVQCSRCLRDHLAGPRITAGWVCDGCNPLVPDERKSCSCNYDAKRVRP